MPSVEIDIARCVGDIDDDDGAASILVVLYAADVGVDVGVAIILE